MESTRLRREPPRFRRVAVRRVEGLTPRLTRVTLAGPELDGFVVDLPAASVRLLLPSPGADGLVMPTWNGNEFLLPDGSRPAIRTFTPRRADPAANELDVDVVLHDGGAAPAWARTAEPGDEVAVSGPGRGYAVDPEAAAFLLAGDETAIPAISQLLEVVPHQAAVDVRIEIADPAARMELPAHPGASVQWVDDLFEAVRDAPVDDGTRVWVAGEAAVVQRVRKHLFDERGVTRQHATVRGYWKRGRAGDTDDG